MHIIKGCKRIKAETFFSVTDSISFGEWWCSSMKITSSIFIS